MEDYDPFGRREYLAENFPEIEAITVEVEQRAKGVPLADRKETYTERNFPGEVIRCRNRSCNDPNGGFHLGSLIGRAVKTGTTEIEDHQMCLGYEMSPKGRKVYDKCFTSFQVKLKVKYKPTGRNPR